MARILTSKEAKLSVKMLAEITDSLRHEILGKWRIDDEWIESYKMSLGGIDVVSIDVFDTAITRLVETPVDVFALVELVLVEKFGTKFCGFAAFREQAERGARIKARDLGQDEVTLSKVLAELALLFPVSKKYSEEIAKIEVECEAQLTIPVPEILAAVRIAEAAACKVVFVSDMYLPHEAVRHLLGICGYSDALPLLVSSETQCTKSSGAQWTVLRQHVEAWSRILHIGDNPHSDRDSPAACGIKPHPFTRVCSYPRSGGPLTPDILPFSLQARSTQLGRTTLSLRTDAALMSALGRSWGAVVVGGYTKWIARRAEELGLRHLFFCARDGWLPHATWECADFGKRTGITTSYLYVSRRSLNLGAAAVTSSAAQLGQNALDVLADRCAGYTVRHVIERSGLSGISPLMEEAHQIFGSHEHVLVSDDVWNLKALFQRSSGDVYQILRGDLDNAVQYLRQEGLHEGAVGLVDVGWNGTLQSSIARILRHAGCQVRIFGFYCGLWNDAQKNRPSAGWMEGAFGSDFIHDPEQYAVRNAVDLLENLFAAPEGTTTGYRSEHGRMVACVAGDGTEQDTHQRLIAPFQKATLEVLERVYGQGRCEALTPEMIEVAPAMAALARLSLSPGRGEMEILGSILHCSDFSHAVHVPILEELWMENLEEAEWDMKYRSWPLASALALLSRLSGETRAKFLHTAREQFAHVDSRTLGQLQ